MVQGATYQNLTLCVPKRSQMSNAATVTGNSNLSQPIVISSFIAEQEIPPNHVLLRVERFGFSANNLTYGALGEDPHFRSAFNLSQNCPLDLQNINDSYFDFHPAPETAKSSPKTHGVIPIWGFGTVVYSTHGSINTRERLYGYFAMSRYVLLPLEAKVNKYNCYVPRPYLPAGR